MKLNTAQPKKIFGSCRSAQQEFSAYLDGDMSGVAMQQIAGHLDGCVACGEEFAALRAMQKSLAALRTAQVPENLQTKLADAIAEERARGTHLRLHERAAKIWAATWGPMMARIAVGSLATVSIVAAAVLMLGAPTAVQANDEPLGAVTTPHYLYSLVPLQPIGIIADLSGNVPVLVEADIDANGRAYDYRVIAGPTDPVATRHIEANLLASVFEPATAFGVPVNGKVMVTYTGISVHG